MMRSVLLSELQGRTTGALLGDDLAFSSISTDTRSLKKGDLFFALAGERFDARDFVAEAAARGAAAVVVQEKIDELAISQLVVADCQLALGELAGLLRNEFSGPVIGLTGSVGKTSCKEMLTSILSLCGSVLSTAGNFNNEIGVPLTLFGLTTDHEYAVIEMGAAKPGDISYLCGFVRPDVALVTTVAPAHLESFGSVETIAKTKAEIYAGLSAGGTAVINRDNRFTDAMPISAEAGNTLNFSAENNAADVYACNIKDVLTQSGQPSHSSFELHLPDGAVHVELQVPGRYMVLNALAAAACAVALDVDKEKIQAGLSSYRGVKQRMQSLQGISGSTIVDDSYNANPTSVRAAIDVLASAGLTEQPVTTILVLGVMGELGPTSASLHADIGLYAAQQGIDCLYGVGEEARHAVKAFADGGRHFADRKTCIEFCRSMLLQSAQPVTLLVKGSRAAGMEAVVDALSNTVETT